MASVWKDRRSKFWVGCFTDRNGRRLKRSTRATNRREALRIAEGWEDVARRLRTVRQVRAVVADLHKAITGEEFISPSTRDFFNGWLERKGPEVAPSTMAFYRHSLGAFLAFLGEAADKPLDGVTLAELTAFRNHRLKVVAARTANHDLKALRAVFKAAKREGALIDNPAEFLDAARVSAAERK